MMKQDSIAEEWSEAAVAGDAPPPAGGPVAPISLEAGFGSQHLAAISEYAGGFREEAAPPFAGMPEAMPPPPLRPVLPPDLQPEPERPGLMARLLGTKRT